MSNFNIYLCGVGGQGIGLLSEIILRAADRAELNALGVDTHGLAQRGGTVSSHIRTGNDIYSPMVPAGKADLVISLERHEALRGAVSYASKTASVVYYDTCWQPLPVRLKKTEEISKEQISTYCEQKELNLFRVYHEDIPDTRMQNIALLGEIARNNLIPHITINHYEEAMKDLLSGEMLHKNLEFFKKVCS